MLIAQQSYVHNKNISQKRSFSAPVPSFFGAWKEEAKVFLGII